jgi:hypothetical protein
MQFHLRRRHAVIAVGVCILVAVPVAFAAGEGRPFTIGKRNPTSGSVTRESQVIANIDKDQGGSGKNTGGFSTRQSNLSESGGGAIYGCRATAGNEACIASNNLANGDAFRFQVGTNAPEGGIIRFGTDLKTLVNKPPFVTNGTGVVANLNAQRVGSMTPQQIESAATTAAHTDAVKTANAAVNTALSKAQVNGTTGNGSHLRGVTSTSRASAGVYNVVFAHDVSSCAITATLRGPDAGSITTQPTPVGTDVNVFTYNAAAPPTATDGDFHITAIC